VFGREDMPIQLELPNLDSSSRLFITWTPLRILVKGSKKFHYERVAPPGENPFELCKEMLRGWGVDEDPLANTFTSRLLLIWKLIVRLPTFSCCWAEYALAVRLDTG